MISKMENINNFIDSYVNEIPKPAIIKETIFNFLNELYERGLLTQEDKVFLKKTNYCFLAIINEIKKGVINICFKKNKNDEITIETNGFGNDDYEIETLYIGIDKKDFIKADKDFVKQKLKKPHNDLGYNNEI